LTGVQFWIVQPILSQSEYTVLAIFSSWGLFKRCLAAKSY